MRSALRLLPFLFTPALMTACLVSEDSPETATNNLSKPLSGDTYFEQGTYKISGNQAIEIEYDYETCEVGGGYFQGEADSTIYALSGSQLIRNQRWSTDTLSGGTSLEKSDWTLIEMYDGIPEDTLTLRLEGGKVLSKNNVTCPAEYMVRDNDDEIFDVPIVPGSAKAEGCGTIIATAVKADNKQVPLKVQLQINLESKIIQSVAYTFNVDGKTCSFTTGKRERFSAAKCQAAWASFLKEGGSAETADEYWYEDYIYSSPEEDSFKTCIGNSLGRSPDL
jgi:hypothetical protein